MSTVDEAWAHTARKFKRLIQRVLDGVVVPFLGAGVSYCAECEGKHIADTGVMAFRVCREVYPDKAAKCNRDGKEKCPDQAKCRYRGSLAHLCEEYLLKHPGNNRETLVRNILEIHKFDDLSPQPAHRYIAFLAREGLVDEIITTNFDTCVSRAYEQTFYDEYERAGQPYKLIYYLNHYREKEKSDGSRAAAYPHLKVYHTNGCADCLRPNKGAVVDVEGILLTERQLQDWRKRHWARDLLKDRLRCKTIVFSGFGSPEPQVRFTVLQVMEEMSPANHSGDEATATSSASSAWDRSNALFVHAFDALTFEQKQMLAAYASGHGVKCSETEIVSEGNCFLGSEVSFFSEHHSPSNNDGCVGKQALLPIIEVSQRRAKTQSQLPADLFWNRVYTAAFWCLLRRALDEGSPFHRYLQGVNPASYPLLLDVMDWLLPPDGRGPGRGPYFGKYPEFLDLNDRGMTRLSEDLWWVRHRRCPRGPDVAWYAAVRDRNLLIPAYFVLLYVAAQAFARERRRGERAASGGGEAVEQMDWRELQGLVDRKNGVGVWFRLANGGSVDEGYVPVFLAHPGSAFTDWERVDGFPQDCCWAVQVVVGQWSKPREVRILVPCHESVSEDDPNVNSAEVGLATVYQVSLTDVVRSAGYGGLSEKIRDRLLNAADTTYRGRVRVADRAERRWRR
ncbi:MAG: hypothetical protein HPY55_11085 [Firmicutes bacterium]|nr:hypothetical protein [Bacillota bacterium]